jgi:hypothetical protein
MITSRIDEYTQIKSQLTALNGAITLQPLSDAQLVDYLTDYPDLLSKIRSDEGLNAIARTPLLLSIMTFTYKDLPDELRQLENLQHETFIVRAGRMTRP